MATYPAYLSVEAPWLNPAQPIVFFQDNDTVGCEICGKMVVVADLQAMVTNTMMAGAPTFPPYQCNAIEHFACSMEHLVVAQALCLMEHMTEDGDYAGKGTAFSSAYNDLYAAFGTYVATLRATPPDPSSPSS